jgi:hypothetical protein
MAFYHHKMCLCGGVRGGRKKTAYLFWGPDALPDVLSAFQEGQNLLNSGLLLSCLLLLETLATLAGHLLLRFECLLHELNVLQPQLFANDVEIPGRVDITLDVDNLGIVKAAHHLEDGVDSSDVRQEGVTKASTGRSTACQAGNVIDCEVGGDAGFRVVFFTQPIEPIIGNDDSGLLGVDGGIGKVLCSRSAFVRGFARDDAGGRYVRQGFPSCIW